MFKKIFLFSLISIFVTVSVNADSESKHYDDWGNDYHGKAVASYCGTTENFDLDLVLKEVSSKIESIGFVFVSDIKKLSKEEEFLIWKSLNEYSLNDNEIYSILWNKDNSNLAGIIYVIITNNGRNFSWYDCGYWKSNAGR